MKLREAIGQIIRELRREREMSLRTLSENSAVALGYVSEVERGQKEASSEILECLARGLDVPLSQIVIEAGYRIAGINSFEIPQYELDKILELH
jgi:transcriptional regulator with XRE-family HTH domain